MRERETSRLEQAAQKYGVNFGIVPPESRPFFDSLDKAAQISGIDLDANLSRFNISPIKRDPRMVAVMVGEELAWKLHDGKFEELPPEQQEELQQHLGRITKERSFLRALAIMVPEEKNPEGINLSQTLLKYRGREEVRDSE